MNRDVGKTLLCLTIAVSAQAYAQNVSQDSFADSEPLAHLMRPDVTVVDAADGWVVGVY